MQSECHAKSEGRGSGSGKGGGRVGELGAIEPNSAGQIERSDWAAIMKQLDNIIVWIMKTNGKEMMGWAWELKWSCG